MIADNLDYNGGARNHSSDYNGSGSHPAHDDLQSARRADSSLLHKLVVGAIEEASEKRDASQEKSSSEEDLDYLPSQAGGKRTSARSSRGGRSFVGSAKGRRISSKDFGKADSSNFDYRTEATDSYDDENAMSNQIFAALSACWSKASSIPDPALEVALNFKDDVEDPQGMEVERSSASGSDQISADETEPDVEHGVDQRDKTYVNRHTDPFAHRQGRTLTWQHVNMVTRATKKRPERKILDNCWGEVPKRQVTAVMGASGAGKTSLLNILAGRLQSNKKVRIEADVRLNNFVVDPTDIKVRQSIAFVAQDDSLQVTATPRECIRFSAKMRLPRTLTDEELDSVTDRMLVELGLVACADTFVGGMLVKGISGGERKRTSVGVELVTKPSMVFLDEPTSGLDSYSAIQCCEVLSKVAKAGASVLFTIHQPSSEIFETFDHLILMNRGRVMYQGPIKGLTEFFGTRGHPVPRNYNPADWIIDVAQGLTIEELNESGYFPEDPRNMGEAFIPEDNHDILGRTIRVSKEEMDAPPPGTCTQIQMLTRREFLHVGRDPSVFLTRVVISAILSFFVGQIFWGVGKVDQADRMNLQSQMGAIMVVLLWTMLIQGILSLFVLPEQRPVFLREYSTNHYSVFSYFVSHVATEAFLIALQTFITVIMAYFMIGFKGSLLIHFCVTYGFAMVSAALATFSACTAGANIKLAVQFTPLLFAPQMLLSGFFVSPDNMAVWLRWSPYACPLTYAVRILIVEEFTHCSAGEDAAKNCESVLSAVNANPDDVWWYWIMLFAMYIILRILGLIVLQQSAMQFY